jgi:hypothetical protein
MYGAALNQNRRRPGQVSETSAIRDPYAETDVVLANRVTALLGNRRRWLWAPAFAGATKTYPIANATKNPVKSSVT